MVVPTHSPTPVSHSQLCIHLQTVLLCVNEPIPLFVCGVGTGFVGRHLAEFLAVNRLCSKVRVVDKVPPATAWLSTDHKVITLSHNGSSHLQPLLQAVFQEVDFKQANLAVAQSAERAFSDEDGPFDFVFNLGAETKYGQASDVSMIS